MHYFLYFNGLLVPAHKTDIALHLDACSPSESPAARISMIHILHAFEPYPEGKIDRIKYL